MDANASEVTCESSMDQRITEEDKIPDGSEDITTISVIYTNKLLGFSHCGPVLEAQIPETGEIVAVKKVDITLNGESKEIEYLRTLKHCNIVKLLYYFRITQPTQELDYLVMEHREMSLKDLYKYPTRLPMFEIRLYMYQLIRSVAYMHNQGICHRGIKPRNILIDPATGVLKLCDFGLAYEIASKERHSIGVGTPRYMAPEMLLRFTNYTKSIDVWGIGCIFVELLKRNAHLFGRGRTDEEQLHLIIDVFGTPTEDQFPAMEPSYPFEDLPIREAIPWEEIVYPYPISDDAISLCSGLLCYSPSSRLLPHKALAHKFFDYLRSPVTTCLSNGNPLPPLFDFQPGEFPGDYHQLIPSHISQNGYDQLEC